NSTAKKISGNSCGRTGCRTEFSNPSTTSSITAATPGTRSSISRGKSCPSRAAIGQPQVIQSEDWYKPKVIRLDDGNTPRGYLLEWFVDVFDRFCTPSSARDPNLSATSATDLFSQDFSQFSSATSPLDVADKNDEKSSDIN